MELTQEQIERNRELFIALIVGCERIGSGDFIQWLDSETDFFTAPCSTKYHLSVHGGLCLHSIHVFDILRKYVGQRKLFDKISYDNVLISALGHDVCKADFYGEEMRNVKENGKWVQKPYFMVKDKFPYGHGEKSVLILSRFMELTVQEQMAIRWHMGLGNDYAMNCALNEANKISPLVPLLHMADYEATNVLEIERVE